MTTVESNKLIAQFMGLLYGLRQEGIVKEESKVRIHKYLDIDGTEGLHINHLKFNSSWDWLIPVIHFINENHKSTLIKTRFLNSVSSLILVNDIDHAFVEVANYIRQYNDNNPSHS